MKITIKKVMTTYLPYFILFLSIFFLLFFSKRFILGNNLSVAGDVLYHYTNEYTLIKHIEGGGFFDFYEQFNSGYPMMNHYQPLYYSLVSFLYFFFLGLVPLTVIHNTFLVIVFSLTPLGVFYLLSKFRYNKMICGLGALLSVLPIGAFGHTIEAYNGPGILTFSLGALFYFFTFARFHEFVYYKKRHITDTVKLSIFFTLSFLAHQWIAYLLFITILIYLTVYFFFHAKKEEVLKLIKPLSIILIIPLLLASFWLIPKLTIYSEYALSSDSLERTDSAFPGFTIKMFVEKLFNGELLDSTDNFNEDPGGNFRWSNNHDLHRFPILSIFSIIGFIILLFKIKGFNNKFFLLFFISSAALICGYDDIPVLRFMPLLESVAFVRFIFLFNLAAIVASAIAIYYVTDFFLKKLIAFYRIKRFNEVFYIIGTLLILSFFFSSPIRERYYSSNILMDFVDDKVISELKDIIISNNIINKNIGFEWRDQENKTIYNKILVENYPRIYGNAVYSTIVASDSDIMRNIGRREIIDSENLMNLFNIEYVLTKRTTLKKIPDTLELIDESEHYKIYKRNKESGVFEFSKYEPYMGVLDNSKNLLILNNEWINSYKIKVIPPIIYSRKIDSDLINRVNPSGILYFKKDGLISDYNLLKDLISRGIKVVSSTKLPGSVYFYPEKSGKDIDLIEYTYAGPSSISDINHDINFYSAKVYVDSPRILVFKKSFSSNWNVFIDNKPAENMKVSPYFNAVMVPAGSHLIEYKFQKSIYEKFLLFISIIVFLFCVYVILFYRRKKKIKQLKSG